MLVMEKRKSPIKDEEEYKKNSEIIEESENESSIIKNEYSN